MHNSEALGLVLTLNQDVLVVTRGLNGLGVSSSTDLYSAPNVSWILSAKVGTYLWTNWFLTIKRNLPLFLLWGLQPSILYQKHCIKYMSIIHFPIPPFMGRVHPFPKRFLHGRANSSKWPVPRCFTFMCSGTTLLPNVPHSVKNRHNTVINWWTVEMVVCVKVL